MNVPREADLERIEGGQYTDSDVRALVNEVRYLRRLSMGLIEECRYWSGVVSRTSTTLYLRCMKSVAVLREKYA